VSHWWDRLAVLPEPPPQGDLPRAAVLAALYPDGDDVRLVLTKRPLTMPTHAGHIAFPGGRPDAADAGPMETALREAEEEVGLDPATVDVLGFLAPIHTVEFALLVVPVVGRLPGPPKLVPSPQEVDKVLLPTLDELSQATRWTFELWNGRKIWFFPLEGEILWGATAMMVRRLIGLEL